VAGTTSSTAGQDRLVATLEEVARVFKEAPKSAPPVVVINQLPPTPPVPSWHQDPELPAVGAAVGFVLIVLLVAGGLWLRRYRPDSWKKVKAAGWRLATWVALPLSWLCGHAATVLRRLHEAAEVAPTTANQVSRLFYLYTLVYRIMYVGTKCMYRYNIYIYIDIRLKLGYVQSRDPTENF